MKSLERRATQAFLDRLWADDEGLVEALVDDGWPRGMARSGLEMHKQTWEVEAIAAGLEAELQLMLGDRRRQIRWPSRVHHIWPALPGAGITPVLIGQLLGIPQGVRPSSRGRHFAAQVARHGSWELLDDGDRDWRDAELVVVSGSDETLWEVRRTLGPGRRVVGYGHRVSFAVVDDDESTVDLTAVARALARDVVMWHQQGCFSVRAVLFCGDAHRRQSFCEYLGAAIADCEARWDADEIEDAALAQRAQALGLAQMRGEVWGPGLGYIRAESGPFRGEQEAIHSVTVHALQGPGALDGRVELPPTALQAVAMAGAWRRREQQWLQVLCEVGVTRVAQAGTMQSPCPQWWHDGRPNILSWVNSMTLDFLDGQAASP